MPNAGAGWRWRRTDAPSARAGNRGWHSRRPAGNGAGLRTSFDAGAPGGRHAKARPVAAAELMREPAADLGLLRDKHRGAGDFAAAQGGERFVGLREAEGLNRG